MYIPATRDFFMYPFIQSYRIKFPGHLFIFGDNQCFHAAAYINTYKIWDNFICNGHGCTYCTTGTGQDKFHKDFGPFTEGFVFIPGDDIAALDKALDGKTVAGLLLETVQGESGVKPLSPEFIEAAAGLCAQRDILLMFDEIQCGMGRTGSFLAFEQYTRGGNPVKADIVTLAKALAGGIPAGAVLAGEKAAAV